MSPVAYGSQRNSRESQAFLMEIRDSATLPWAMIGGNELNRRLVNFYSKPSHAIKDPGSSI